MSKFTVKPYIEQVLAEVSDADKLKLLNFINGKNAAGTGDVSYELVRSASEFTSLSSGVHAVEYRFSLVILWKGYFIKTTNFSCFITFKNGIDLWLASVYKVGEDNLVPMEKCTADNLRCLLKGESGGGGGGGGSSTNVEDGTGTNSIQQKMPHDSIDFTGRNPNAIALDPTLATTIDTGAGGGQSAAFGKDAMALSTASFANGNKSLAKGEESHAEGYQSVTLGDGSHAEGAQTVAKGLQSHSEGALTQAIGDQSHAEGQATISGAMASHAEGVSTKTGNYSQDGGIGANQSSGGGGGGGDTPTPPAYTAEYGEGSHTEGYYNIVKGYGSHAEGLRNYLDGNYSHAEGVNNTNTGDYACVGGFNNINTGDVSFVCGNWNNNSGYGSLIGGSHNKNTHDNKSVLGRYNEDKSDTIFEIGCGTADNDRKNAFEVVNDGTIRVSGQPLYLDLGNTLFTGESGVTVNMQHSYKIGALVFVHLNINVGGMGISSTGIVKVGTLSKHAAHEHLFVMASHNSGAGTATDIAYLETSGNIKARFTGTTAGNGYNHDLCFFFAEEN